MKEAIEECYDRLGRYLNPDLAQNPIQMGSGNKYKPYHGRCARTGVEGDIVDHHKSDGSIVPTSTKLLWMVAYQNRVNKTSYRLSFGYIALLRDEILSTTEWASRTSGLIPDLRVVATVKDILRRVVDEDRYLLLCFGKNIDRTLDNGLRYSCNSNLEVNGELAGVVNRTINLDVPLQLARLNLNLDDVRRYCDLRNRSALTDEQHHEMLAIKNKFGEHAAQMVGLSRQVTWQDTWLARWLSQ